jgi:hypothetical protein
LSEPWILDIDTTVKPLYGHQEGAVVSYNPQKPGRPSHSYHCYMVGNLRLVLAVDVAPRNQHTSKHSSPRLWKFGLGRQQRPWLIRGDSNFGNEPVMREAEQRGEETGHRPPATTEFYQSNISTNPILIAAVWLPLTPLRKVRKTCRFVR